MRPCLLSRNVSSALSLPHASLCACSPESSPAPHRPEVDTFDESSCMTSRMAPQPIQEASVEIDHALPRLEPAKDLLRRKLPHRLRTACHCCPELQLLSRLL
eukprot:831587-Rhodomonas_salina.1